MSWKGLVTQGAQGKDPRWPVLLPQGTPQPLGCCTQAHKTRTASGSRHSLTLSTLGFRSFISKRGNGFLCDVCVHLGACTCGQALPRGPCWKFGTTSRLIHWCLLSTYAYMPGTTSDG